MERITDSGIQHISVLIDKMVDCEIETARSYYQEVEEYLQNHDFTDNHYHEVWMLLGLTRYDVYLKNVDKIIANMDRAEELCKEHSLTEQGMQVRSAQAVGYSLKGDHLKAIYIWEDMLEEMTPEDSLWMMIMNNLTVAYVNTKQFTKAVDLSYELLSALDDNEDQEIRLAVLINLANSYTPIKMHEKSLSCLAQAVELCNRLEKAPLLGYIYSNMSSSLTDLKRYEEALVYARKAVEYQEKYYGDEQVAETYSMMGRQLFHLDRFDEAEDYLKRALEKFSEDNRGYRGSAYLHLGNIYLAKEDYAAAKDVIQKGYELSRQVDVNHLKSSAIKMMAVYFSKVGDYQGAVKLYEELIEIKDEQYLEITQKMISRQEAEYLTRKIAEKSESYRVKNLELESSNSLINKQAKALQKSNQELHNSLSMLNRLIKVISHDVRGPVSNSVAALRMIQDQELDPQMQGDLIGQILDSLDSTADLLTEIMIWIESRSYSKKIRRLMRDVSIAPLIKSALKLYRGQISQKRIRVSLDIPENAPEIFTEPNTLKIVLRNILSNAVKYTKEEGKIEISCRQESDALRLEIKDDGCGMSSDELQQLKENKIRSKEGSSQEFGMGMGLRLSLGYLKLLSAEYDVYSQPGQGTSFVIHFRRQD